MMAFGYDLPEVERNIDALNLSREAQHHLNELLWANDRSSCDFYFDEPELYRALPAETVIETFAALYSAQLIRFNAVLARRMFA